MLLNLWELDTLISNFMTLFNVTGEEMCDIIRRVQYDGNSDYVAVFCEETEKALDEMDISENVEFAGKIVSTTIDDFNHLKQFGLLPIDTLLETDSPISRHLKKYQIIIKPSEHRFYYKDKCFYLPYGEHDCEWCACGDNQCRFEGKRYKDMHCSYLKAVKPLAVKLYHDNSEIEMFLQASKEQMLEYSRVQFYPEIFQTIEELIKKLFNKELSICHDWREQKQQSFIININVKYNDMSYRDNYICGKDGRDAYDLFEDYERFCNNRYDDIEDVPRCFWDNYWLISACLEMICNNGISSIEKYAGINHNVRILYNDLTIEKI